MGVIAKPHTFSPNTTISSSQMNANFDTIYNDYNGGIAAANLASNAVTTAKIADLNVTTAKIANDAINAAKLLNGVVRARQGGTTGDATWATVGSSNTDVSDKDVFIQVGSRAINATPTTITFPNAYTQVPIVFATTYLPTTSNAFTQITAVTTTNFSMRMFTDVGAPTTTEFAFWMAIGQ